MAHGISTEVRDGVLRIVLDRPAKRNATDIPMLTELNARLADANDSTIRVVEITGAGGHFSAGGDLGGRGSGAEAVDLANAVVTAIAELPKPVVAGVQGAAVGFGCPLALACDLVVADRSAFFQLAFTNIGLVMDGGASALLPAAIGRARATRMAMLAERISAATAFEWGLVSHLAEDGDYATDLAAVVNKLAAGPTLALGWIKRVLERSSLPGLADALALEAAGQSAMADTSDFREGVRAFRERRSPSFGGH